MLNIEMLNVIHKSSAVLKGQWIIVHNPAYLTLLGIFPLSKF